MKKFFMLIGVSLLITSCDKEESVAPNYETYIHPDVINFVNTYYNEAEKRGVHLDRNIIVDLSPLGLPESGHMNYADYSKTGQKKIILNSQIFYDMDEQRREALVFFYLSRAVYGRSMIVFHYSFLNPDLFVYGYDPEDREFLFNELFQ